VILRTKLQVITRLKPEVPSWFLYISFVSERRTFYTSQAMLHFYECWNWQWMLLHSSTFITMFTVGKLTYECLNRHYCIVLRCLMPPSRPSTTLASAPIWLATCFTSGTAQRILMKFSNGNHNKNRRINSIGNKPVNLNLFFILAPKYF
jgi:hypothetical protein